MSTQENNEQREFLKEIHIKGLTDKSYRERLIANPLDAIQELYPEFYPGDTKIVVQDQTAPKTVFINISRPTIELFVDDLDELELTEEELEMVSGGGWPITLFRNCFNRGCTIVTKGAPGEPGQQGLQGPQ